MAQVPNLYRVSFLTEVIPESGDTMQGLAAYVREIAADTWLPENFTFTVEAEFPPGSGKFIDPATGFPREA